MDENGESDLRRFEEAEWLREHAETYELELKEQAWRASTDAHFYMDVWAPLADAEMLLDRVR